jgi:hypothetical protein
MTSIFGRNIVIEACPCCYPKSEPLVLTGFEAFTTGFSTKTKRSTKRPYHFKGNSAKKVVEFWFLQQNKIRDLIDVELKETCIQVYLKVKVS